MADCGRIMRMILDLLLFLVELLMGLLELLFRAVG